MSSNVEGIGEKYDALSVSTSDEEFLELRDRFQKEYAPYWSKIAPRVKKMRESYLGEQAVGQWLNGEDVTVANLQFEAEETYLAAAVAKNPDPFCFSDNSPEGEALSTATQGMLQFHAKKLNLKRKLAMMVRQHSIHLLGVIKVGWDSRNNDIAIEVAKIENFVFDPKGYVDASGFFTSWYGEHKTVTAERLVEMFPKSRTKISEYVGGKMGTEVVYTEWWPNDDLCFYTFQDIVLDKHKNAYFNYPLEQNDPVTGEVLKDEEGNPILSEPKNHFLNPRKPCVFLSVYSLQEQPHDITSLIEQNIPNQNRISEQTKQIDKNVRRMNNSEGFSEANFNEQTAKQAAKARENGNPIIIPRGGPSGEAIVQYTTQGLPPTVFDGVQIHKNDLRSSWGVNGISPQVGDEDQTARGMILQQSQDTSRITGSIGQSIETVAGSVFDWMVQLYYVFYDEPHVASIIGNKKSVEYITLSSDMFDRKLTVGVAPDSMMPKDPINEANLAQALFDKGVIGPLTLLKMLDFPNPEDAGADGMLYKLDPMTYFQQKFPNEAQQMMQSQMAQMQQQAPMSGGVPPEQTTEPTPPLTQDVASAALSQVPMSTS